MNVVQLVLQYRLIVYGYITNEAFYIEQLVQRVLWVLALELTKILKALAERYGIRCDASFEELLSYLNALSYGEDAVSLDEILNEELLLHEVVEICFLKNFGYKINRNTILDAYPDTYRAHLEAMNIELAEAKRMSKLDWMMRRCKDLEEYLNDPYPPYDLEPNVEKLN